MGKPEDLNLKSFIGRLRKLPDRKIIFYLDKFLKTKIPLIIKDDLRKMVQREFLKRKFRKNKKKKIENPNQSNVIPALREKESITQQSNFEEKRKSRIAELESKKIKSSFSKIWKEESILNTTWGDDPLDPPKQEE